MGSVRRRPDGRYRARWYDLAGKEHAKHFTRKRDADNFLATVESDKLRGLYVDPTDKTTVGEYARRWAAARPHNPRTARRTASLIRCHVEGTSLGRTRLSRVLPSDAQAWVSDRALVLAPLSLEKLVGLVRSIFAAAVLDRLVATSPFARVSRPESHAERIVPLTVEQVRAISDAMPRACRAMVLAQAGLGVRIGELISLRKQDVNFLRRSVRIQYQIPPGERVRSAPKTRTSVRTLPLPQFVADALAQHIQAFPPLPDGTLFYSRSRLPWSQSYYASVFRKAVAKAGLPASSGGVETPDTMLGVSAGLPPRSSRVGGSGVTTCESTSTALPPGTTSHDLRHHYASVLLHAGESVIAVAERLGHRNANLVLSVYGHLLPDSEERTRKALDGAWNAPPAVPITQWR
jgi:integrase